MTIKGVLWTFVRQAKAIPPCVVVEIPLEGKGFDSEMKNKLRDLLLEVGYPRIPNESLHEDII